MSRVLLAGESWITATSDHKGFDPFSHVQMHVGCDKFLAALRDSGHDVRHIKSHDVATDFPFSIEQLNDYDVVILSDIGSNSLLLPPQVFEQGQRCPNRLKVIREWVGIGHGFVMVGGYLSFQGYQGIANYAGSPIEDVLPVKISRWDDRKEAPEGLNPSVSNVDHRITRGLDARWPTLLGYQLVETKKDAQTLATVNEDPLLVVGQHGKGRTAAFMSDISPHWATEEFMQWLGYKTLFNNLISWLADE